MVPTSTWRRLFASNCWAAVSVDCATRTASRAATRSQKAFAADVRAVCTYRRNEARSIFFSFCATLINALFTVGPNPLIICWVMVNVKPGVKAGI